MTQQTLLILSFSRIASDARVLKQVERFRESYRVVTCGYGSTPDGVETHVALSDENEIWRYDRVKVIARLYASAYWTNKAIAEAREKLSAMQFDIVLANDVDSVGVGLQLAPRCGVHADLHEYAPRQKEDITRWRLFVAPFMTWMCRRFVTRARSVTTVGEGIAKEYAKRFGINASVVTNAAPYQDLAPQPVGDTIKLVHSGACLRDRNIAAILDAVETTRANVSLDLYLTPNDPAFLEQIRQRAASSDRVTFHEPVPYSELANTLNSYDVGVHILPPVNFNNTWALPNKFFDYVQARLGVIIGPSPEMVSVLTEHGFGSVADDFTADALARAFDSLDPVTVATWKAASDEAAQPLSSATQVEEWARNVDALCASSS